MATNDVIRTLNVDWLMTRDVIEMQGADWMAVRSFSQSAVVETSTAEKVIYRREKKQVNRKLPHELSTNSKQKGRENAAV